MALQKKMDDIWLTFSYQTDEFEVNPKSAMDPSFWHISSTSICGTN